MLPTYYVVGVLVSGPALSRCHAPVVKVSGDKVRLGIEAPANIKVLRNELEIFEDGPQTLAHPAKLLMEANKEALPLAS